LREDIVIRQQYRTKNIWPANNIIVILPDIYLFTENALNGLLWSNIKINGDGVELGLKQPLVPSGVKVEFGNTSMILIDENDGIKESKKVFLVVIIKNKEILHGKKINSIAKRELAIARGLVKVFFDDYLVPITDIMIDSSELTESNSVSRKTNSIYGFKIATPIKRIQIDEKFNEIYLNLIEDYLKRPIREKELIRNALCSFSRGFENSEDSTDFLEYWFGLEASSRIFDKRNEDSARIISTLAKIVEIPQKGINRAFDIEAISKLRDLKVHFAEEQISKTSFEDLEKLLRIFLLKALGQKVPDDMIKYINERIFPFVDKRSEEVITEDHWKILE